MARVAGRPFLEHLIERLRQQGFREVLLCLGYLAEDVERHFGDGSSFGIRIGYDVQPAEFETGARIRAATDQLDDQFLLLYCDNVWPFDRGRMLEHWTNLGALDQITVYVNDDGYSKSNVRLGEGGLVEVYDKSRSTGGLDGVDIGFAILHKGVLDYLPDSNCSFESEVYPRLAEAGKLAAFRTRHRYYGVGTFSRIPSTERFLGEQRTVLLDRDGVLNERPPRAQYVTTWDEWKWIPGSLEALVRLSQAGSRIVIISNQPGIARGMVSESAVQDIHRRMAAQVEDRGGQIESVYYCPHGWDEGCGCRKPAPGLLIQAQRDYALDLSRCVFVGDDERDGMAADAAGCGYVHLHEGDSLSRWVSGFLESDGLS
jgi:D-glycero-D-manno-heptose 1,7-bisphosphate phosphatase